MRTTVILDDELYRQLVQKAIERYGSAKNLSKLLNALLRQSLQQKDSVPASMFGAWKGRKGLSTEGLREEGEPH